MIGVSFGFESLEVTLWGIASDSGALNLINLSAAFLVAGVIVWLVFRMGPRAVPVAQEDTYAAGAAIPKEKYHHTVDFYHPLEKMISPYFRDFFYMFYTRLAGWTLSLCNGVRRLYTGYVGQYVMYIVLFLAILVFVQLKWGLW